MSVAAIQAALGHVFAHEGHLLLALTHRSYAHEQVRERSGDNERLEFLGDSILGAAAAQLLFESFPDAAEGELTRRRAELVCERSLAELAQVKGMGPARIESYGDRLLAVVSAPT